MRPLFRAGVPPLLSSPPRPWVQVADFGLSRECVRTAAMTRVGSVQWAAPEVLLGHGYSEKCDVWSFGVVCWELMTARIPFDGMSQASRNPKPHPDPTFIRTLPPLGSMSRVTPNPNPSPHPSP